MAMAMAAVLLLFVLAAPTVHSLQYDVKWNIGINYNAWAAGKTFTVGDTLVFTYTSAHAVAVVDGSDYADCNTGNPLHSYTGGLTTITLAAPGPIYFICPIEGHCQVGMKLGITVVAAASPTTPTSPPPASTTTPTTPATTPTSPPLASTTTPTTPATAPTSPPPASTTSTPTSTPSPSPSVSPSPTVTSPSGSPSSGPSPTTSTSPVVTAAPSSPKSSSGAGIMFGEMNHLVVIGLSVIVAGLAGFLA